MAEQGQGDDKETLSEATADPVAAAMALGDMELLAMGDGGNSQRLQVHSQILEVASPVLRDLLNNCCRLSSEPLKVEGNPKAWELIIRCLYHSSVVDPGSPAIKADDLAAVTAMLPVLHKYDFSALLRTCLTILRDTLKGNAGPAGYDYCEHGYQASSFPHSCTAGCGPGSFMHCMHQAEYGTCSTRGCLHSHTCSHGFYWGMCGNAGCERRPPKPGPAVSPGAVTHLLLWLRLSIDLQLDDLKAACLGCMRGMPRRDLASMLDGKWEEILAMGKQSVAVGELLVAAMRS